MPTLPKCHKDTKLMECPLISPDINPIENLLYIIKIYIFIYENRKQYLSKDLWETTVANNFKESMYERLWVDKGPILLCKIIKY